MKIGIANDHRGVKLKRKIVDYLHDHGYSCVNYGTNSDESVDYVDYAEKLCKSILKEEVTLGILICGTGIGMSIAANKIKGIKCARVISVEDARLAREHNMVNVIALGENTLGVEAIVSTFLNTECSKIDRYIRRNNKINDLENNL